MWSSSVHASSSLPSRDNEMRHGAPVCATDSSMWMVSGPGAMAVTSPENWLSCAPQGPFLMPVSELRAVGHAKREWDEEASESSMRAWSNAAARANVESGAVRAYGSPEKPRRPSLRSSDFRGLSGRVAPADSCGRVNEGLA